jgi:murein DD-endopeptidase MepM/ murein hydrolase activator NlpD
MSHPRPARTAGIRPLTAILFLVLLATAGGARDWSTPAMTGPTPADPLANVAPAPAETQPAAPALAWDEVTIRSGDTLARLLAQHGATAAEIHAIATAGDAGRALSAIRPGASLRFATDTQGRLQAVNYEPDVYRVVSVTRRDDNTFEPAIVDRPTLTVQRYADGIVTDSLFASGSRAGLSDRVILEMADVFGYEIDFALEVQEGDSFRVLHEEILVDGVKVRDGAVLSAEYMNRGKAYRAVRYVDSEGHASWYAPDGTSMRKAFLRTPVDFARISSRFNLKRRHPVLHSIRAHKGVDYAAARGTPVRATGEGRIEYAGNKGGYGRVVIIQHGNRYSTLYAHLNGYARNIRSGARVTQGQIIGYVGSSGMSTGPHLHYEFRVGGAHVDPLSARVPRAKSISAAEMPAFLAEANRLVALLDSYGAQNVIARNGPTPAVINAGM